MLALVDDGELQRGELLRCALEEERREAAGGGDLGSASPLEEREDVGAEVVPGPEQRAGRGLAAGWKGRGGLQRGKGIAVGFGGLGR